MMIEKQKPYRNRRLLNLAHRLNECQFQIEGVCQGYSAHGCEPAHSNFSEHGKGMGIKAADDQHVASCFMCHRHFDANKLGEQGRMLFDVARNRTFALYRKNKWLDKVGYAEGKLNGTR